MHDLLADLVANLRTGLRAAVLRRVALDEVRASADQLTLLVFLVLLARFGADVAFNGTDGYFNVYALSAEVTVIAALMLAAYATARMTGEPRILIAYPVVLLAMDLLFLVPGGILRWAAASGALVPATAWNAQLALIAWFLVAAFATLRRVAPQRLGGVYGGFTLYCVLFVGSFWVLPPQDLWMPRPPVPAPQVSIADEAAFHAQPALLDRALGALAPQRPGVADIYFVGFAAYAHEDVFMKEINVIERLFAERFDARGRTIKLINNPGTAQDVPVASLTHLRRVLHHLGSVMDREEDILVLYVTSHGTEKHRLSVVNTPLRLHDITPAALKQALDESAIRWRVLAISACYAGGFIEPLKNATTLIMTAADARKQSFGCGTESDFTFFGKAVFDEELRRTHSFSEAFARARESIAQRERDHRFEPSNPQIHVGGAIAQKLREVENRLQSLRPGEGHLLPDA